MIKLSTIVINTNNSAPLRDFWTAFLGTTVASAEDGFTWLAAEPGQPRIAFQEVADPTGGRRRLHLDFEASDMDAEVARALELGATTVEEHTFPAFRWMVLADPDGNEFCISPEHG